MIYKDKNKHPSFLVKSQWSQAFAVVTAWVVCPNGNLLQSQNQTQRQFHTQLQHQIQHWLCSKVLPLYQLHLHKKTTKQGTHCHRNSMKKNRSPLTMPLPGMIIQHNDYVTKEPYLWNCGEISTKIPPWRRYHDDHQCSSYKHYHKASDHHHLHYK